MAQEIIYGIIKRYKGIFKKKHAGNIHTLIVPIGTDFLFLNVVGSMRDKRVACQLILRTDIRVMDQLIKELTDVEDGNFSVIERIPCKTKVIQEGIYQTKIPKKGKNFKSDIKVEFSPEYSQGDIKIYFITGKIMLFVDEHFTQVVQARTVMHKKKSLIKTMVSKLKSKFRSKE